MMIKTAILLRQKVPKDVERITFTTLDDVDDMWMMLFYKTCRELKIENIESWNWGGTRYNKLTNGFAEVWYPSFERIECDVYPDLIFARGGFKEYIPVMQRFPDAIKIYYGAGKRYDPKLVPDPTDYDIILVDTEDQCKAIGSKGWVFNKPACDTIFQPVSGKREYDIVFIANAAQKKIKGIEWFYEWLCSNRTLRILQIGNLDVELCNFAATNRLNITFTGWIPRKEIPEWACKATLGICCSTDYESCPRVIPEYLAMNLPIVVLDTVRVSYNHVNEYTGIKAGPLEFAGAIDQILRAPNEFKPYWYYKKYLSLDYVSTGLAGAIDAVAKER